MRDGLRSLRTYESKLLNGLDDLWGCVQQHGADLKGVGVHEVVRKPVLNLAELLHTRHFCLRIALQQPPRLVQEFRAGLEDLLCRSPRVDLAEVAQAILDEPFLRHEARTMSRTYVSTVGL